MAVVENIGVVPIPGTKAPSVVGKAANVFGKVSHLSKETAEVQSALAKAAKVRKITAIETADGRSFFGRSTRAGGPGVKSTSVNQAVKDAYDAVPVDGRSGYHGFCREAAALSNTLDAGADVQGALSKTIDAKTFCAMLTSDSCQSVLGKFGIKGE